MMISIIDSKQLKKNFKQNIETILKRLKLFDSWTHSFFLHNPLSLLYNQK